LSIHRGTVYRLDSTTQTTNNSVVWDNVDYYEENGFKLDFRPNIGSEAFATKWRLLRGRQ